MKLETISSSPDLIFTPRVIVHSVIDRAKITRLGGDGHTGRTHTHTFTGWHLDGQDAGPPLDSPRDTAAEARLARQSHAHGRANAESPCLALLRNGCVSASSVRLVMDLRHGPSTMPAFGFLEPMLAVLSCTADTSMRLNMKI